MKISPEMIDAMLASGLTAEQVLLAVKAMSSIKSADAVRKARSRAGLSRTVTDKPDIPATPLSPLFPPDKENPPTPPKENNPPISPNPRRGSRLPTDWMPDEQIAAELGLTLSQANAELAKFRDYWAAKAGKDAAKLDWTATWRNWVRTAMERMPRAGPGSGKPRTASDVLMNLSNEMKAADDVQQPSRSDFVPPRQLPRLAQRPSDGGEGLFDVGEGPDGYRGFQDR